MSSPTLHFPSAEVMTKYLSNHKLLTLDYYKEKGITDTVSKLAASRFADSDKIEMGVKMGAQLIAYDLKEGEDGISGEKITKIDGLPPAFWIQFSMGLEAALIDCAKNAAVAKDGEDGKDSSTA